MAATARLFSRRGGSSCLQSIRSPVAAEAFLQVATKAASSASRRSSYHTASLPQQQPQKDADPGLLEFLVPNVVSRYDNAHSKITGVRSAPASSPPTPPTSPIGRLRARARGTPSLQISTGNNSSQARSLTTTSPHRATAVLLNPRIDEDGNEMSVEITPRASKRLSEIMTKDSNPNLALRITVESGGCHGFQYLMSLTTLPPFESESSRPPSSTSKPSSAETTSEKVGALDTEEDTVFQSTDGKGAKVVMDLPSLELLKGSKIDYTMELIGSQFKIVDNPLATSSCGCGTSFDIKV